jgi:hypothetical protein
MLNPENLPPIDQRASQHLPDANRMSTVAAVILLAYALARLVDLPPQLLGIQLPGFYLPVAINIRTIVVILVAAITACGADWLLRDHPALGEQTTLEHWLAPALTAMVISIPLFQLPPGPAWWLSSILAAGFLMLILTAEYIVVDDGDVRQPLASAGLTVLSFLLYFLMAVTLRMTSQRLFLTIPALALVGGLVSLRTLHLRLHAQWALLQAGVIVMVLGQIAAALFYLRLSPVAFGLILIGIAYGITNLIAALAEGDTPRQALSASLAVVGLLWIMAIFFR